MCGIAAFIGESKDGHRLVRELAKRLRHRGPDRIGFFSDELRVTFGHTRLRILDLSDASDQPLISASGRYVMVYNGEVYNYREIARDLRLSSRTRGDSKVLLEAIAMLGLEHALRWSIGMFAGLILDRKLGVVHAFRDRIGVKPLHIAEYSGGVLFCSEVGPLVAALKPNFDQRTWASYFGRGLYVHDASTFWEGISVLPAGTYATYSKDKVVTRRWYDLGAQCLDGMRAPIETGAPQSKEEAGASLLALLDDSIKLRLRSDVPVGVCLSGGLDSQLALALASRRNAGQPIQTYTYYSDGPVYDERPHMVSARRLVPGKANYVKVTPRDVVERSPVLFAHHGAPFGGVPNVAMDLLFECASQTGTRVLIDGNGLDEAWAGYDYYGNSDQYSDSGPVQGASDSFSVGELLKEDFLALAKAPDFTLVPTRLDVLRRLQIRDITTAKLPRVNQFADRTSMRHSVELREPFMDHRILEQGVLAERRFKIQGGIGKYLPRTVYHGLTRGAATRNQKQAVQTPQREWLRRELRSWAEDAAAQVEREFGGVWFRKGAISKLMKWYMEGSADNSFPVWQLLSLSMAIEYRRSL